MPHFPDDATSGAFGDATTQLRRVLPDLYFINTPLSQRATHLELLRRVESEKLILDLDSPQHSSLSCCTICAFDAGPGLLAKVCATLIAERVDIQTAFVFSARSLVETSREVRSKRRVVLDTFWLSETLRGQARACSPKTLARVRDSLRRILSGESAPPAQTRRLPVLAIDELSAVNSAARDTTLITLRAQNSRGVLHRATAALAAMDLDVCVAQINTEGDNTNDVFFVSKNGKALSESELLRVVPHLRALMQGTTFGLGQ